VVEGVEVWVPRTPPMGRELDFDVSA